MPTPTSGRQTKLRYNILPGQNKILMLILKIKSFRIFIIFWFTFRNQSKIKVLSIGHFTAPPDRAADLSLIVNCPNILIWTLRPVKQLIEINRQRKYFRTQFNFKEDKYHIRQNFCWEETLFHPRNKILAKLNKVILRMIKLWKAPNFHDRYLYRALRHIFSKLTAAVTWSGVLKF